MKPNPTLRPALLKAVPHQRGFALVVTLTLMILLTILAVGLLSLSTISLRSSGTQHSSNIARANARMALMIAIGQLQKATGPDQRITATADIAGAAGGARLAAGASPTNVRSVSNVANGMTGVQPGTRHWTGVWQNNIAAPTLQNVYLNTPSPKFLQWLVSGNEKDVTGIGSQTFDPSASSASVGDDGNTDPTVAVVLVGEKSVGDASQGTVANYVSAPVVKITGTAANKVTGRYAWWVGDEGVKAKVNRTTPYVANAVATYPYLSAQRAGWEAVDGFAGYPGPGASMAGVVTVSQMKLVNPDYSKGEEGGSGSPINRAFHAATTDSFGLLADTFQGGLRVDLTTILAGALPTSTPSEHSPAYHNMLVGGKNIVSTSLPGFYQTLKGPAWDRLKDFIDTGKNSASGSLIAKAAPSLTAGSPIAPIIVDLRLLMGARLIGTASPFRVNACGKVAVTLANPYGTTLTWNSPLELSFENETPATQFPSRIYYNGNNRADDKVFIGATTSEPAVFTNATFRIPAGELPPGGARAYTQAGGMVMRPRVGFGAQTFDLSPWDGTAGSFSSRIELESGTGTLPVGPASLEMDVRESEQSSQVTAILKLGGTVVRRIERFELDNGDYQSNKRVITTSTLPNLGGGAFGLQCYNFQISQPGAPYEDLLPLALSGNPTSLGLANSTLRTFTDFNVQASRIHKPIASYTPAPYVMWNPTSLAVLPLKGGVTGTAFTSDLNGTVNWGRRLGASSGTILFTFPRDMVSLAQFQHADLTADNHFSSVSCQPGNAFGNSYATPFLNRNELARNRVDHKFVNGGSQPMASVSPARNYYDMSFLLNAALWDTYYFSTLSSPAQGPLNASIVKHRESPQLTDPLKAAGHLMINGAFNINSTNEDAWKAFLGSSMQLKHPADGGGAPAGAMFPRSLEQTSGSANPPTGNDSDSFSGYRRLDNTELSALATEITKQVRLRGPFVSLSHFVNRALVSVSANPALGRSGALQSAIDASGVTIHPDGTPGKSAFSDIDITDDKLNIQLRGSSPRADLDGPRPSSLGADWATTSLDLNPGSTASIYAERAILSTPNLRKEQGFRSTGIPGWLTQADVLQVIGPSIAARSDTFKIRAYGEAVDPATGRITAKAWCEAVVQRTPDYVDPSNAFYSRPPASGSAGSGTLSQVNRTFGRKYEIVSFTWLPSGEI